MSDIDRRNLAFFASWFSGLLGRRHEFLAILDGPFDLEDSGREVAGCHRDGARADVDIGIGIGNEERKRKERQNWAPRVDSLHRKT